MSRPQDYKPGEQHRGAKMTEAEAVDVLRRIRAGDKYRVIAADRGVAISTIGKIAAGVTWKHLNRRIL